MLIFNVCVIILSSVISLQCVTCKPFQIGNHDLYIYNNTADGKGNYHYRFQEADHIIRKEETGKIEKDESGNDVLRIKGDYYYNRECFDLQTKYTADENGYRASTSFGTQHMKEVIDGKVKIFYYCVLAPVVRQITSKCLASLQGGCTIG